MSGSSSPKPSSKGYSPVPVEPVDPIPERIDDGINAPQEDAEDDDENLYSSSAPLLSSRSRGNEPPRFQRVTPWYANIQSWRPFQRDSYHPAWNSGSKKARNWRRIFLLTSVGTLLAAVVGLSISTGLLAEKLRHSPTWSDFRRTQNRWRTHLPFNSEYISANFKLSFPQLYPKISSSSYACQSAWDTLRWVPCHEKIWNRSWDNGTHSLFDPNISLYAEALCRPQCTQSIYMAHQLISSQCSEDDKFDMAEYTGPFTTDPGLEDSPRGVITTIQNRLTHMCRPEPSPRRYYTPAKCVQVMWEDWLIVDGMNAGNLEGLDMFERKTNVFRTEPPQYKWRYESETCDNVAGSYYGGYGRGQDPPKNYGPAANSTTCGWCTMSWFERKLLSWKKDEIRDPKTGAVLTLPEYLRRIQHVGQRCESDAWGRVWDRAVRKYKASGDLSDDWDKDRKGGDGDKSGKPKKPCKEDLEKADDYLVIDLTESDLKRE